MKNILAAFFIVIIIILFVLAGVTNSESNGSKNNSKYKNDAEYRHNVDCIADKYDENSEDVEAVLQAASGEVK